MSEKRKIIKKKLFSKSRLIILNEDNFEEIFSLRLTLMNVFVVATISTILIITFTTYLIAFTPLREYIPGYASTKLKKEATELSLKSDSLALALQKNEAYLNSIKKVLTGELEFAKLNKDSILATPIENNEKVDLSATDAELKLREQIALEEKEAKAEQTKSKKLKK